MRRRRPRAAVLAVAGLAGAGLVVAVLVLLLGGHGGGPELTADGRVAPLSRISDGVREIGALYGAGAAEHDCTASVVDSPGGDTLMTAAHCVVGSGAGMTFEPGEVGERAPEGRWTITAAHVTSHWATLQDPHEDVAFLTVAPQVIDGRSVEIERVTGGYRLGPTARAGERVRVTGYPEGTDDDAVSCVARIYLTDGYPSFDCSGFANGTSGSPWVLDAKGGREVVGLIGGLHQGGCLDATSYSPLLSLAVRDVYALAQAHEAPTTVPAAGSDGC